MKTIYVYPGTFCPPHYGHIAVAKEAAEVFGSVTVICSVNPVKEGKMPFTPEKCKEMWLSYDLGKNIDVVTFDEFFKTCDTKTTRIMVRGIRNDNDIKFENSVILDNYKKLGIRHYHYILSKPAFMGMSSTKARIAAKAGDLTELEKLVNADVAAKLAERMRPEI
jgi:pantetheine-phosphate adenylyltransferase